MAKSTRKKQTDTRKVTTRKPAPKRACCAAPAKGRKVRLDAVLDGETIPVVADCLPLCATGTACIIYRAPDQTIECLEAPAPAAGALFVKMDASGPFLSNT